MITELLRLLAFVIKSNQIITDADLHPFSREYFLWN
jgi:hypothetical protein